MLKQHKYFDSRDLNVYKVLKVLEKIYGVENISSKFFLVAGFTGCASIIKGTSQKITINTVPPQATCTVVQNHNIIATIAETPQIIEVSKSKHDLTLTCDKPGYQTAIHVIPSDVEAMTIGNVLLGGVIGLAIDAGTGALNKYDANVTITLVRR